MKKVLLTTTALVLTAGVASAEITFSGTGEAGFYRTGKVKAAAAKTGVQAQVGTGNGGALIAAGNYDAATDATITLTSGKEIKLTAATGTAAKATDATLEAAAEALADAKEALAVAQSGANAARAVAALANTYAAAVSGQNEEADRKARIDQIAYLKAKVAEAQAVYDAQAGTAAVAAVNAGDMKAYSGYDFEVAANLTAANGMTFAMGFDMGAGSIADQDDDRELDEQAEEIATSALTIGYNNYTIKIGDDKIDDLYDDSQNGDVSLAGSFGDLKFELVTDMDKDIEGKAAVWTNSATAGKDTFTEAVEAEYNPTSYSIAYAMGDMSFSMAGTEHDDFGNAAAKYSLTYAVLPSLSATLSSDNVGTYKDIGKLSATYTVSDAMSITASVKDDKDHALNTNTGGKQSQDMSIAYSAGALSATIASDESSNWWVNAKYDLGGGATAFTTFDHTEFLVAGVNFAF